MSSPFDRIPATVCILRLSAIGDTCHVLPVVRTLQRAWPETKFTWIIGKVEAKLLGHIPEIEFIVLDKRNTSLAYRTVRRAMRGRQFDVLMHMQVSLRANLLSSLVPARVKLGFDRAARANCSGCSRPIASDRPSVSTSWTPCSASPRSFTSSRRCCAGTSRCRTRHASTPVGRARGSTDADHQSLLQPCSAELAADHYAQVADHAAGALGMRVVLCGGRSEIERRIGAGHRSVHESGPASIRSVRTPCSNFWRPSERATILLTPDSGPAHMASAVGTPVVGLYAATNPARSGPYLSRQWCIDKYDAAARARLLGKPATDIALDDEDRAPRCHGPDHSVDEVQRKLHGAAVACAWRATSVGPRDQRPGSDCDGDGCDFFNSLLVASTRYRFSAAPTSV